MKGCVNNNLPPRVHAVGCVSISSRPDINWPVMGAGGDRRWHERELRCEIGRRRESTCQVGYSEGGVCGVLTLIGSRRFRSYMRVLRGLSFFYRETMARSAVLANVANLVDVGEYQVNGCPD